MKATTFPKEFWPRLQVYSTSQDVGFGSRVANTAGVELGKVSHKVFKDGEQWVRYEDNVRGADVFIVGATNPPAENLLEMLIMIDGAKRASARKVTAVIPYFGYARQDRKDQPRVSITAKLVANLITKAGADRVITVDLHAPQIQGFFDIPVDHLYASAVLLKKIREKNIPNLVVASCDVGGIKMARSYAKRLQTDLILIDKRRPEPNKAEVMNIIGNPKEKNVLIVDDLIDTASSLINAAITLINHGALDIYACASHGLFSHDAIARIQQSPLKQVLVTNTLPRATELPKIETIDISGIIGEATKRAFKHMSITSLFDNA